MRILLRASSAALALTAAPGLAQELNDRPVAAPAPSPQAPPADDKQVQFSADALEYDNNSDVVTATGDVRMSRQGNRLRADKVVWDRHTGKVVATGNIAVANPQGDTAFGDSIELTDTLKDGVVENMLVVLDRGGRIAAARGVRHDDGVVDLDRAAYSPCAVVDSGGCPKEPSWKITAVRVTYRPDRERVYFVGGRFHLLGLPTFPLPKFSAPVGGRSDSGLLAPDLRFKSVNGLELTLPYFVLLAPNRSLTVTPHLFSAVLPMLQLQYDALGTSGAFRVTGYGTVSRRSDDITTTVNTDSEEAFRGYLDVVARYQLTPEWTASGSARRTTDRTFLRRYDISRDDRLRSTASLEHIDRDSYFAITGWAVQTLRVGDNQGMQPVALPEIDYRRRLVDPLIGGRVEVQANSLALTRTDGQDTQRAFVSAQWDWRGLTNGGQELTLTAFARGDAYTRMTRCARGGELSGAGGVPYPRDRRAGGGPALAVDRLPSARARSG